jgi:hypothetical protein
MIWFCIGFVTFTHMSLFLYSSNKRIAPLFLYFFLYVIRVHATIEIKIYYLDYQIHLNCVVLCCAGCCLKMVVLGLQNGVALDSLCVCVWVGVGCFAAWGDTFSL